MSWQIATRPIEWRRQRERLISDSDSDSFRVVWQRKVQNATSAVRIFAYIGKAYHRLLGFHRIAVTAEATALLRDEALC